MTEWSRISFRVVTFSGIPRRIPRGDWWGSSMLWDHGMTFVHGVPKRDGHDGSCGSWYVSENGRDGVDWRNISAAASIAATLATIRLHVLLDRLSRYLSTCLQRVKSVCPFSNCRSMRWDDRIAAQFRNPVEIVRLSGSCVVDDLTKWVLGGKCLETS